LCFFSNIAGVKKNIVIPLKDVKKLQATKTLGFVANAIKVSCENEIIHYFTGFTARDEVLSSISKVWATVSQYAEKAEGEEEEGEADELDSQHQPPTEADGA